MPNPGLMLQDHMAVQVLMFCSAIPAPATSWMVHGKAELFFWFLHAPGIWNFWHFMILWFTHFKYEEADAQKHLGIHNSEKMAELRVKSRLISISTTLHLLLYFWNCSLLPVPRPDSISETPEACQKYRFLSIIYFDFVDLDQVLPGSETADPNQCTSLETHSEIRSFFIQQIFVECLLYIGYILDAWDIAGNKASNLLYLMEPDNEKNICVFYQMVKISHRKIKHGIYRRY